MSDASTVDSYGSGGPGVVVCHAWWGLSEGVRAFARRLADAGFLAVTPDLFDGRTATTPEDAEALVRAIPSDAQQGRFDAAVAALLSDPRRTGAGIAAVGFSLGVGWALGLAAARPDDVDAVVFYYGASELADVAPGSFAALGHFAEHDRYEEDAYIEAVAAHLAANDIPYERHRYPGTGHWFAESDVASAFDATASDLALARTVAFLRQRL